MSETIVKPKKLSLVDRLVEARKGVPEESTDNPWESTPEDITIPTPDGVGTVTDVEGKLATVRGLSTPESTTVDTNTVESDEVLFPSRYNPSKQLTLAELNVEMGTPPEQIDALYADQTPIDTATSPIGRLMQRFADRVENGAHRADRTTELASDGKEYAKNKLRGAGRAALRAGKASAHATSRIASATAEVASRSAIATAEFAVGTGVITGQKGLELADRADAAVIGKVESAATAAKDAASGALDKSADLAMAAGRKIENGMDIVGDKLIGLKKAALARRKARREVWAKRFNSAGKGLMDGFAKLETGMDIVGDKMINAKDKVIDKTERTKASVNRRRNLGRLAIDSRRS